jgi:hypothetical protein
MKKLKARWEAFLIRVAKYILHDRNVTRSPVVSRRDNNEMWEMGWHLEDIAGRIEDGYNKPSNAALTRRP